MIEVVRYESAYKLLWDGFIESSKNGSFLFYRDYMEYHSDRFFDSSLMFFDDDALVAVMPANLANDTLYSHQGLTYGGIISDQAMRTGLMLSLFASLMDYLEHQTIKTLHYKAVPHIYHVIPAEEDLYGLFRNNAKLVRRDVSTAILLDQRIAFSKGKSRRIKLAKNKELEVKRTYDFRTFMSIVADVLASKYSVTPTHTVSEIQLLARRFPNNIKLFAAYKDAAMLAGVVVYQNKKVIHAQYIAASEAGQTIGAGELVWDYLLNDYYLSSSQKYFDFGISTEQGGRYLNSGLIAHKEGFGARATMYDTYEVKVGNKAVGLNSH